MIIGNKHIDFGLLRSACVDAETLTKYVVNMVPETIQHIPAIVDNQKYYAALHVRNFTDIPYYRRMELCNELLRGVKVRGTTNELYDYRDLLAAINVDQVVKLWENWERQDA